MIKFIILVSLGLVALIQFTNGLTQDQAIFIEDFAFKTCDNNTNDQLSWTEVEACEDEFGKYLEDFNIGVPTEEDFNSAAGKDGQLTWVEISPVSFSSITILNRNSP